MMEACSTQTPKSFVSTDPFRVPTECNGVTYDGQQVWFAAGDKLNAFDPASGKTLPLHRCPRACGNGFRRPAPVSARRGSHPEDRSQTGRVLATIPAPGGGRDSGLAWAEGTLWVGQYRDRKIHQIDPETGAILRTIESNRFVTGVTWVDGELWHGTWEGEESDLRRSRSRNGRGAGAARYAGRCRRVRARVRWRRSVLLRRRNEREGQSRPAAQARLRGGPALRSASSPAAGNRSGLRGRTPPPPASRQSRRGVLGPRPYRRTTSPPPGIARSASPPYPNLVRLP